MTITVQVSDFRNNMAMYLGKLEEGYEIELKKGKEYEAKLTTHPKKKKMVNNIDIFLRDIEKLRKKYGGFKTNARTDEELVNEIDRIVYGVDRNGKELSENDR